MINTNKLDCPRLMQFLYLAADRVRPLAFLLRTGLQSIQLSNELLAVIFELNQLVQDVKIGVQLSLDFQPKTDGKTWCAGAKFIEANSN